MTPAFHLLIPFARMRRIGGLVSVLLMAAMGGTAWAMISMDFPKEVSLFALGTLLTAMLGKEALPMLKPGLVSTDGLRVSGAGMAFTRKGKTVEWRWDEISDLRVRSRLHPASLFLGKFISFRVPHDNRRQAPGIGRSMFLGGGIVAIGDDYPGRPDDLLQQMEHFRADAAKAGRSSASAMPEATWSFRKDRKRPKLAHFLLAIGGPIIGMAVAMVIIGEIPGSIEALIDDPGVIGGMSGAVAMLPLFVVLQFRFEARQDNMMVMSAGGLHSRAKLERRFWLWRDIIDMQVTQSASRGKDGNVEQIISFTATHDGSSPGKVAKEGEALVPVSCSIEDNYEMPVTEIGRQARIWWEWSGETFGHAVVAPAANQRTAAPTRQADAIAFRRQTGTMNGRSSLLDQIAPMLALTPMLGYTLATIWMLKAEIHLDLFPWWLDLGAMAVLMLGSMIAMITVIQPGFNRLELTEEGLLHVRYGFKRRWAWHEIGAVELRRLRTKWSAKQRSVVTLEADAGGWTYGLLRWVFNIDQRRRAVIEDIYDSSLDEIAEAISGRRRVSGRIARS